MSGLHHPAPLDSAAQARRELAVRLVQLAADAVRLRTHGEPVRGCDSAILDARLCTLALDLRRLADELDHRI